MCETNAGQLFAVVMPVAALLPGCLLLVSWLPSPTHILSAMARLLTRPCRTYRLSQNVKPLIWVECQVEKHSRSRIEYLVKARSQFKERSAATSVEIVLPLPPDAITPTVRTSQVHAPPWARPGRYERAGHALE